MASNLANLMISNFSNLKQFVFHNRISLLDALVAFGAIFLTATLVLGMKLIRHVPALDLVEVLALVGLTCIGMLYTTNRHIKRLQTEIERRIAAESHAQFLAHHDALTTLPNRRMFDMELNALLAAARPSGRTHAVFLMDLNGFKKVNDVFGHHEGDAILVAVAQRLQSCVRDGELVSRFGGDEFAVLVRNLATEDEAMSIASRMIASLTDPIAIGANHHAIGVGIGIALIPAHGRSSQELVRKADLALYRAKAEAGSAIRYFNPNIDTPH
jgi:diguanylate cyclase (GGDEF)-like protein